LGVCDRKPPLVLVTPLKGTQGYFQSLWDLTARCTVDHLALQDTVPLCKQGRWEKRA
jgi:hypothetical protein